MELDIHNIYIVHKKGEDKIWQIFDNSDEALNCAKFGNDLGGNLAVDNLYAFLSQTRSRAEIKGLSS